MRSLELRHPTLDTAQWRTVARTARYWGYAALDGLLTFALVTSFAVVLFFEVGQ
ncbi:MAG: hypothetical protein WCA12_08970 [Burkholderiales bacterium]